MAQQHRDEKPKGPRAEGRQPRPGDWLCPECKGNNFPNKTSCHHCGVPKPGISGVSQQQQTSQSLVQEAPKPKQQQQKMQEQAGAPPDKKKEKFDWKKDKQNKKQQKTGQQEAVTVQPQGPWGIPTPSSSQSSLISSQGFPAQAQPVSRASSVSEAGDLSAGPSTTKSSPVKQIEEDLRKVQMTSYKSSPYPVLTNAQLTKWQGTKGRKIPLEVNMLPLILNNLPGIAFQIFLKALFEEFSISF
jgi:hypothetical protein